MTADGVIPYTSHHIPLRETGHMYDAWEQPVSVGVKGDAVVVNGIVLDPARCETFARLFTQAVWEAGRNAP